MLLVSQGGAGKVRSVPGRSGCSVPMRSRSG